MRCALWIWAIAPAAAVLAVVAKKSLLETMLNIVTHAGTQVAIQPTVPIR
jgi:hypothetical protein